jgi:hypothetical protein
VFKLVPPIFADDLVFLDLVNGPSLLVLLVQEDGLEDVVLDGPVGVLQLILEVMAIETHLEKLGIRRHLFDQVHPESGSEYSVARLRGLTRSTDGLKSLRPRWIRSISSRPLKVVGTSLGISMVYHFLM